MCKFAFVANLWSLIAGIPTKIVNAFLYSALYPDDIPGFMARYPLATTMGCLIYFIVTVLVEGIIAWRWLKEQQSTLSRKQIWRGVILANAATYAVLAPLSYYQAKPSADIRQFTNHTHWTRHAATTVLFIAPDGCLKSIQADGSNLKTIVPIPMEDYVISSNFNVCLFRGSNGNLYLYRHDTGQTNLIWTTIERFSMNQVAFSPSGQLVAVASENGGSIQVIDVSTGNRTSLPLSVKSGYDGPSVAWSPEETNLFIGDSNGRLCQMIAIKPDGAVVANPVEGANAPALLKCYERPGNVRWGSGPDWGTTRSQDSCGDLKAWATPGLVSMLRIYHESKQTRARVLTLSFTHGLMHVTGFRFDEVEFLEGCDECLFDSYGYIYVLDINGKRLGTLVKGDRFIQLTPKDERSFQSE